MDIIRFMNRISAIGRYLAVFVVISGLLPAIFAADATSGLTAAISGLCSLSQTVLGGIVMLLIVLAGATYAIGQVLGAETRARASVWATAMLTGAIIGAVIFIVAPYVLDMMVPTLNIDAEHPCGQ